MALRIVSAAMTSRGVLGLALVGVALPVTGGGPVAAPVRAADATGILQVAPRGQGGAVRIAPVGNNAATGGEVSCDPDPGGSSCICQGFQQGEACRLAYVPGTPVTLTPVTDGTTTLADWSDPDCPGTGPCTTTVGDTEKSVVATFAKLTLRVRLSSDNVGRITSAPSTVTNPPAGIDCSASGDAGCDVQFAAHSQVVLQVVRAAGNTDPDFKFRWAFGCVPNGDKCTVTMSDEPQWVGVAFGNDGDPEQPGTIDVAFQVRKAGSGSGRVTGKDLDCGGACTKDYRFGTPVTLDAKEDEGSVFAGWGGVCGQQTQCTVPAGPVTAIQARFDKEMRDTVAPSAPRRLTIKPEATSLALSWGASTDNVGVTGYTLYLNGEQLGLTSERSHVFDKLTCGTTYTLAVDAVDAAGNHSTRSALAGRTRTCATGPLVVSLKRAAARGHGSLRQVVSVLNVTRATTATLTLALRAKRVASGRFSLHTGANTLALRLARGVRAGSYKLTLTIRDPTGGSRVFNRSVKVAR